MDLEPPGPAQWTTERNGDVRVRRLPARATLVHWVRFDRSAHPTDAALIDTGGSFTVTYWPSEFSQVRAQYRRTNYTTAPSIVSSANELLFQFQFSIGAHGAHPF
jgi:hypothetical protein